jgi:ketosteroid isomerase-like protein
MVAEGCQAGWRAGALRSGRAAGNDDGMHPNEQLLRAAYSAFAAGDIPGFTRLCTPDFRMHVPGSGLLSGEHSWTEFLGLLGPAMQAVEGSFREEVVRVVASDELGAVVAAQEARRDGALHRWSAVHVWRIADGALAEFWEYLDDARAYEAAWHR